MKQKILKSFSKIQDRILQRRKLLVAILPILFVVTLLFPSKAFAIPAIPIGALLVVGIIGPIIGAVAATLTKALTFAGIVVGINLLALSFGGVFIWIGTRVLNWAVKGGAFAAWSMTNPANNYIINIGWTLLRDLTNMFFILGLAYIGLATALNFASFNTKKTFTTLIIVALLINFTPVFCGLIVDGTNIISNFFLSEVNLDSASDAYASIANSQDMHTAPNIEDTAWYQWLLKRIILQYYSFLSGSILLIFASLFLLRTFIIWFLVILSPLAFFCRIFDFSKQWFQKWWSMFIGWSIVVIPASFFLYLANHLMVVIKAAPKISFDWPFSTAYAAISNPVDAGLAIDFWGELLPYLLAMTFLVIGFIATLKIKTAGSGFFMNIANKVAKSPSSVARKLGDKAGKVVGELATGGMKQKVAAAGLRSIDKKVAAGKKVSWLERKSASAFRGQLKQVSEKAPGEKATFEQWEAWKAKPLMNDQELAQGVANLAASGDLSDHFDLSGKNESSLKDIATVKNAMSYSYVNDPELFKKMKNIDIMDKKVKYKTDKDGNNVLDKNGKPIITQIERDSLLKQVINENRGRVSDTHKDRGGVLIDEGDIKKYNEDLEGTGLPITDDEVEIIIRKMISKAKASEIATMSKPDLMALLKSDEFQKFGSQAQVAKAAELFAGEAVDALQGTMQKKLKEDPDFYQDHNPKLHNYFGSTPARTLGFGYEDLRSKTKPKEDSEIARIQSDINALKAERTRAVGLGNQDEINRTEHEIESLEEEMQNIVDEQERQKQEAKEQAEQEKQAQQAQNANKTEQTKPLSAEEAKQANRKQPTSTTSQESTRPLTWGEVQRARKEQKKKKP